MQWLKKEKWIDYEMITSIPQEKEENCLSLYKEWISEKSEECIGKEQWTMQSGYVLHYKRQLIKQEKCQIMKIMFSF
jgi:hypothetical protein